VRFRLQRPPMLLVEYFASYIYYYMIRSNGKWRVTLLDPAAPPRVKAEPFGNDIFRALYHRRSGMQGVEVRATVWPHIVPGQQHPLARFDLIFKLRKSGCAAFLRLVKIDHGCPAALPAVLLLTLGPIFLGFVEKVVVILELLPHFIALPLHDFAVGVFQPHQIADGLLDTLDIPVMRIDIAAVAGPVSLPLVSGIKAGWYRL